MKNIYFAGQQLLTGDRMAEAVLDYAAALARQGQADRIEIPVVGPDGQPKLAELILGPASQIVAEHEESPYPEPDDEPVVSQLEMRTLGLGHPAPLLNDDGSNEFFTEDDDVSEGTDLPPDVSRAG